ncbi:MAG: hypothetical protein WBG92_13105 [Thiohalocapsa sp.]
MKNTLALSIGCVIALLLAEGLSRMVLPVFPGAVKLSLQGDPIRIGFVEPGAIYRQFSEEYDALTTITPQGYRAPEAPGAPDLLFVGDSFTFGQGLADDEAFPALYCEQSGVSCVNLGVPGTGTLAQLDRLERYLTKGRWRPKRVFLFVMAMTQYLGAGNDLHDNVLEFDEAKAATMTPEGDADASRTVIADRAGPPAPWVAPGSRLFASLLGLSDAQAAETGPEGVMVGSPAEVTNDAAAFAPQVELEAGAESSAPGSFLASMLSQRKWLLENSNLVRVVKFYVGPLIKQHVASAPPPELLGRALSITENQLRRFANLGDEYGFETSFMLIHPVQDTLRGTHLDTLEALNEISPRPFLSTADALQPIPQQYYFPLDGHLNARGSRRIAEFLTANFGDRVAVAQSSSTVIPNASDPGRGQ